MERSRKAREELNAIPEEAVIGSSPDFSGLYGGTNPIVPALLLRMDPDEIEKRYAGQGIGRYSIHPEGIRTSAASKSETE